MNKIYDPFTNRCNWKLIESDSLLFELKNIQQNQKWHKEGDVYTHTCMVVQELLNELPTVPQYDLREILFYAALLHDVGKLTTTTCDSKGVYHAKNHSEASLKLAEKWLKEHNINYINQILPLIKHHMNIGYVAMSDDKYDTLLNIINEIEVVPFRYFILLKRCDWRGSWFDINNSFEEKLDSLLDYYYENFSFKPDDLVKITKISDDRFDGLHPNGINTGHVSSGKLLESITVGLGTFIGRSFYTSNVTKIIDKNHFKTLNSTYKIEKYE